MANRTVISRPLTSAQAEQLIICELMVVANTCEIEYKRFYAMNELALKYPQIKFSSGNLTWNLDRLLEASSSFEPSVYIDTADFLIGSQGIELNIFAYFDEEDEVKKNYGKNLPANFTSVLFKSSLLKIDGRKIKPAKKSALGYLSSVNISVFEASNSIVPIYFLAIDNPKSQLKSLDKYETFSYYVEKVLSSSFLIN